MTCKGAAVAPTDGRNPGAGGWFMRLLSDVRRIPTRGLVTTGILGGLLGGPIVLLGVWQSTFGAAPALRHELAAHLASFGTFLLLVAVTTGATSMRAEASSQARKLRLTPEPRRGSAFASKVLAPGLTMAPVVVALLGIFGLAVWAIYRSVGVPADMPAKDLLESVQLVGRVVVLSVVAACVGAALGTLVRYPVAVLGVAIGGMVVDQILAWQVILLQPFLGTTNVRGWIEGGTYYYGTCTSITGGECWYSERTLSFAHSAVSLLLLAAVVITAAVLFSSRRNRSSPRRRRP